MIAHETYFCLREYIIRNQCLGCVYNTKHGNTDVEHKCKAQIFLVALSFYLFPPFENLYLLGELILHVLRKKEKYNCSP
uniref:Uncharacterized protein n=1 Tax=Arundo donax TaxID=35708 RepID=A0A0A9BDP4_ARUDO